MALEPIALRALFDETARLAACHRGYKPRILSLGYPDILATPGTFIAIPEHPEAAAIRKWHHWPYEVYDTEQLFKAYGFHADYLDIAKVRGPEILSDLNIDAFKGKRYDIILDPGTIEHVLNIGNALKLIVDACTEGGIAIHTNPCNMGNHGFWSVNPTMYIDWYAANGFKIEALEELSGPLQKRTIRDAHSTGRFDAQPNSTLFCVARKVQNKSVITYPIQTKYRQNPTLKGAA